MSCHEEYLVVALDQLLKPGHSARTGGADLCSPLWICSVQLNDGLVEVSLQVVFHFREEEKVSKFSFHENRLHEFLHYFCVKFCIIQKYPQQNNHILDSLSHENNSTDY